MGCPNLSNVEAHELNERSSGVIRRAPLDKEDGAAFRLWSEISDICQDNEIF